MRQSVGFKTSATRFGQHLREGWGKHVAAVLLGLMMQLGSSVHAQGAESAALNPVQTNKVTSAISEMFAACREVQDVYLPDCVGRAIQDGASRISNNSAYWEAHVSLARISRRLELLVRSNRDDAQWRLRTNGHRLSAVNASALPELKASVTQLFDRANTELQSLSDYENEAFAPLRELLENGRPWP